MIAKVKILITKGRLIVLGVLLVVGFLFYQFVLNRPADNGKTEIVTRSSLKEELTLSGQIEAEEKATIRFATGGQVTWVGVKVGDTVKKYQSIASLDTRSLKKTLNKYLLTYRDTRNDFEDNLDTYENKVVTDSIKRILENSQGTLDSSVIDVEIQDLAVKLANIWTPIEGIVTKAGVETAGVIISSPTQAEFEVVNPNTVYFLASVDQAEVSLISVGDKATLVLDSYPESTLSGEITEISFAPKIDESGTAYAVKFKFADSNAALRYRLGMTGDVTFLIREKQNVLSLPPRFIKSEGDKKYVNTIINGKKDKAYITTGMETGDAIEITSGIAEGTTVSER